MPESTSLHIQDRESSQIRVVEIPWIAVRVGRAAHCEVRLPDGDLAEEACRLQRRGQGWQLIPLGPAGSILVQEQPVDSPHPLPFDVPFRVGSWSMTLRQSRPADADRDLGCTLSLRDRHRSAPAVTPPSPVVDSQMRSGERMSDRPMPPVVASPVPVVATEPRSSEKMSDRPMPPVVPGSASKTALLAESPIVAPEADPVNPWEARWRAAGDRLRSTAKRPERAAEPRSFRSPDRYQGVPLKTPVASLHQQEEPPASWSGRLPLEAPRATLAPEVPAPVMPRATLAPEVPAPARLLSSGSPVRTEPRDEPAALIEEVPQPVVTEVRRPEVATAVAPAPEMEAPSAAGELPAAVESEVSSIESSGDETHAQPRLPITADEPAVASDQPAHVETEEPQAEGQSSVSRFVADTTWTATAAFLELGPLHASVSTTTEALWPAELRPSDPTPEAACQGRSPSSSAGSATLLEPGLPPEGQRPPRAEDPVRPGESRQRPRNRPQPARPKAEPDLPSAKDILAAVSRQAAPPQERPESAGRDQATPTLRLEPGHWSAPLWLFGPPAVLLVLFLGISGFVLSWRWAGDAFCASVVARELLIPPANPGRVKPLPESVVPPEPSWWRTTPLHLAQWGVYLGRAGLDGDRTREGRQLLDAATQIAPLSPVARLSRAQLSARSGDPAGLVRHLGLSRDAASLAWSARALRLAGRKEAAVRVYRQALRLACTCDLSPAAGLASSAGPAFDDDSRVRRYYLPGEATAREIVRELLVDVGWSLQEWSEALPRHTVAALAAARLLREQERPEAQKLLQEILASGTDDFQSGAELAINMATRAEAYALLSQWREAQRQYQQAIDQIDDVTTRRCWWFNLASIALQLDDEVQRKTALQAALEVSTSDDISRRALELQRASQSLGRLRPGVAKAN